MSAHRYVAGWRRLPLTCQETSPEIIGAPELSPPPTPLRITGVPDQMTIVIVTPLFGVGLSACSHFPVRSPAQPARWQNCIPRVTKKGPLRRQQGRLMTERVLSSGACSNTAGRPSG